MTTLELSRRDFLRAGSAASLFLAGGAMTASLAGCSSPKTPANGFQALRDGDLQLLRPLVPVIVPHAKSDAEVDTALHLLDDLMALSSETTRGQFFQLYDLLQLGAARWWLTGFWSAPEQLSADERQQALAHWASKDSSFARIAFFGLTKPFHMTWYAHGDHGLAVGYPGPPKKVNA